MIIRNEPLYWSAHVVISDAWEGIAPLTQEHVRVFHDTHGRPYLDELIEEVKAKLDDAPIFRAFGVFDGRRTVGNEESSQQLDVCWSSVGHISIETAALLARRIMNSVPRENHTLPFFSFTFTFYFCFC